MHTVRTPVRRVAPWPWLALALGVGTTAHAGDFTFGGKVFADVSQLQQQDHVAQTDSRATDADLKRLFLDADYAFDAAWSAHLTTDINWLRGEPDPDLWLRHLYLQRKFASGATQVRLGVDDMPMMALTSQWYGYRYVDSIGTSLQKIDTIADWGVHVKSRLASNLDMAVSVVSGGGYKQPTHGRRADVEALLAWYPTRHALLALGGYDGQLAADDDGAQPLRHTARRIDLMAAYADDTWRFGTRYAYASNWANLYTVHSERVSNWSSWASVQLAPRWSVFARYDRTSPARLLDPARRSRYANAGVQWQPRKRLCLALVLKRNTLQRDGNVLRSSNEAGIWNELTF